MRGEAAGVDLTKTELVCISSFLVRERSAQLKFMLRKLRRRLPHIEVLGCFWQTAPGDIKATGLVDASFGADDTVATFSAAVDRCILKNAGAPLNSNEALPIEAVKPRIAAA